ncbi:hypothetical protein O181_086485 [Austropuccinia psidii MF-1]|uniref:DUF4219 domain-containing protein n=1 Tax=Austropuccinia psidii MF-1 TaxID=1389203 RepID=A0A9Q3FZC6_9BASI|nr:hypothetical protein [Austropuccinia psidii MF-1]
MIDKPLDVKDILTIPILDGTKYGHWQMCMKIHLRSKDLLEVCKKSVPSDSSTSAVNKWTRASFEAINLITTRIPERVFTEVINYETIENSQKLWSKISEQYASKRAVNRASSYLLLGKLGGNHHLSQFVESLIFNKDIIEKPQSILSRLQDFASNNQHASHGKETTSNALTKFLDEPHKIIYYCSNGKHNNKCTTHRKAKCWAENPHLRPNRKDKKCKNNPAVHLSMVQALMTLSTTEQPSSNQISIDFGARHHMFNSAKFFT